MAMILNIIIFHQNPVWKLYFVAKKEVFHIRSISISMHHVTRSFLDKCFRILNHRMESLIYSRHLTDNAYRILTLLLPEVRCTSEELNVLIRLLALSI